MTTLTFGLDCRSVSGHEMTFLRGNDDFYTEKRSDWIAVPCRGAAMTTFTTEIYPA